VSEIDHDIGSGQGAQVIALIDRGGQLEIGRGADRPAHLGPHAPLGAQHPDLDHRQPPRPPLDGPELYDPALPAARPA